MSYSKHKFLVSQCYKKVGRPCLKVIRHKILKQTERILLRQCALPTGHLNAHDTVTIYPRPATITRDPRPATRDPRWLDTGVTLPDIWFFRLTSVCVWFSFDVQTHRLDYQPLFGKMSPHSSPEGRIKTGPGRRWKSSLPDPFVSTIFTYNRSRYGMSLN